MLVGQIGECIEVGLLLDDFFGVFFFCYVVDECNLVWFIQCVVGKGVDCEQCGEFVVVFVVDQVFVVLCFFGCNVFVYGFDYGLFVVFGMDGVVGLVFEFLC